MLDAISLTLGIIAAVDAVLGVLGVALLAAGLVATR